MDRKSDVIRRRKYWIKGRRPISLVSEILIVIQENENITNRQIKLKVKNLSDSTLNKYLAEMEELSLIVKTIERFDTKSNMRGLKPGFVTHYRITKAGIQLLGVMSDGESAYELHAKSTS